MKTSFVLALTLLCLSALPQAQQQPRRDGAPAVLVGTAVVAGVVLSDTKEPVPLRRARVNLSSADLDFNRTFISDDRGRFAFANVPAGRFQLRATRPPYVSMAHGARRPERPGTTLIVADGQQLTGLTLRLPPGAVITGTVLDHLGQPAPGVYVSPQRYMYQPTGRRLVNIAAGASLGSAAETDDRGVYRIYGLAAGEYAVMASPSRFMTRETADVLHPSEADINRVLQGLQPSTTTTPGAPEPQRTGTASIGVGRPVTHAPIYYPGAATPTQASLLTVGPGEERVADMQMALVLTGNVEGTVSLPGGTLPPVVQVTLVSPNPYSGPTRSARAADGRFSFGAVPPGEYVVAARANAPGGGSQSTLWASASLTIDSESSQTVALELQPGYTMTGRLQLDGTTNTPPNTGGWRIGLTPAQNEVTLGVSAVEIGKDGQFTLAGITPGRYRVDATVGGAANTAWWARSAAVDERNLLDVPIDIRGDLPGVVVTYTDKVAQLNGTVQDPAGDAADYFIVLFPADKTLWTRQSRRLQMVRPGSDGKYTIKNVPAGDYLLVATTDVEQFEWQDPAFLARMAPSAIRFTLADGEEKVQDLKVGVQK